MVTVCTVLAPPQRPRVDAAGLGCFQAFHCDTLGDAVATARRRPLEALILSPDACDQATLAGLARFVREFPAIAPIALVSGMASDAGDRLLQLGASGVRRAVDCSVPMGWHRLRMLVGRAASGAAARIVARLQPALGDPDTEAAAFFDLLARVAPVTLSVAQLARRLQVQRVAFEARFRQARLPTPKTYLTGMRLLHATHVLLNPGLSLSAAATQLGYGWVASLNRHVRRAFGVTASEFRARFPFAVLLERYVDRLIIPYRDTLRAFHPLHGVFTGPGARRPARFSIGGINRPPRARPGAPELSVLA